VIALRIEGNSLYSQTKISLSMFRSCTRERAFAFLIKLLARGFDPQSEATREPERSILGGFKEYSLPASLC
jgi:hypothetical protein